MSDSLFDEDGLHETEDSKPRRAESRKRSRRALVVVLVLLLVPLLIVAGVVGYYAKTVNDALSSVDRQGNLMPAPDPSWTPPEGKALKPGEEEDGKVAPVNILIIGSDSRGSDRGRSDALMLAHVAGDRKSVHLISIPRDYWVSIPGRRVAKVNAAYSWGGAPLAVDTVQRLLGITIDHVAITDFQGFIDAIDAVGGVDVYNKQASENGGYSWPKGDISLPTGKEARAYVGQRYGLSGGDFDRNERQRDVTIAVVEKLTSAGVLTDPGKFSNAINTIGPSFTVDEALTNKAILDLGMSLGVDGARNIRSYMAPTAGFGTSSDKQSYVRVDEARLAQLGQALRDDEMDKYYTGR